MESTKSACSKLWMNLQRILQYYACAGVCGREELTSFANKGKGSFGAYLQNCAQFSFG